MDKIYTIQEMNNLYNEIVNSETLSFEQKKKTLQLLLSKIEKYHCYKDGNSACPYSIHLSEEYEMVEFVCDYLNKSGYYNKTQISNRMVLCPISEVELKINKFLNINHSNVLAMPKNEICVLRSIKDSHGNEINIMDVTSSSKKFIENNSSKEIGVVKKINRKSR